MPDHQQQELFEVGDKVRVIPDVGDALYEKPLPDGTISAKLGGQLREGFLVELDRPFWILVYDLIPKRVRRILAVPIAPPNGNMHTPGSNQLVTFSPLRKLRNVRKGLLTKSDLISLGYASLVLIRPNSAPP